MIGINLKFYSNLLLLFCVFGRLLQSKGFRKWALWFVDELISGVTTSSLHCLRTKGESSTTLADGFDLREDFVLRTSPCIVGWMIKTGVVFQKKVRMVFFLPKWKEKMSAIVAK